MTNAELKKELEDLKEEVKQIKKLFESKAPIEYVEYTCPICDKGQCHRFPKVIGKHFMHHVINYEKVHHNREKESYVLYFWVLEIKEDFSLEVYREIYDYFTPISQGEKISKEELMKRGYRFPKLLSSA